MNKHLAFAILFVLAITLMSPVSASAATNPSIKPGSFFYGFVTTFEKINLFFTFNQEKKAEKAMKYADKRLAEAEAVAGDKNSDAVKTAISGYEENIALAAEASKKVKDETKAENLLNLIASSTSKHQEVLADVLSKVPDEAKEAITKAIDASKKGQEEAIKQIAELKQEVTGLKQEVAELKKQQGASSTTPSQNNGTQSQSKSIKELKKEIEGLKKQAAEKEEREKQTTNTTLPTTTTPVPQTEVKVENQAVTLTNSLGISYTFDDPIINKQRVRDLINSGFVVTKGKLPKEIILIKLKIQDTAKTRCDIQENGTIVCNEKVRVIYQEGMDANSLIRPKGISVNISIPALNFAQTATTTSDCDTEYVEGECPFAIFSVPVSDDKIYPVIISANETIIYDNLTINYISDTKNQYCKDYGAFCNSRNVAWLSTTPQVEKISEKKELSLAREERSPIFGEIRIKNISSNIDIKNVVFEVYPLTTIDLNSIGYTIASPHKIRFFIWDTGKQAGTYSVMIKDINAFNVTGQKIDFSGLPITFTFTIYQ